MKSAKISTDLFPDLEDRREVQNRRRGAEQLRGRRGRLQTPEVHAQRYLRSTLTLASSLGSPYLSLEHAGLLFLSTFLSVPK